MTTATINQSAKSPLLLLHFLVLLFSMYYLIVWVWNIMMKAMIMWNWMKIDSSSSYRI
jgi:hypothetical protein